MSKDKDRKAKEMGLKNSTGQDIARAKMRAPQRGDE